MTAPARLGCVKTLSPIHAPDPARALNQANPRKEFFFATPGEVRAALMECVGSVLEFAEVAEATEYRQSVKYWPEAARTR